MQRKRNDGVEKIVFELKKPETSPNGLYFTMGGTTYPTAEYCHIRTNRSGIFWGGIFVFEYIISGKGYVETNGQSYPVSAGDTVLMNALRDITYYSDPHDPYKKVWINFTGDLARGMISGLSLDKNVYIFKYPSEALIKEIHGLHTALTPQNRADSYDRMAAIVFKLMLSVNSFARKTNAFSAGQSAAERVKEFIDGLTLPNVTLDDLALRFDLNKNYLIHSFKNRYGIPPNQYIISKKIERAKKMMMDKDMSISEISVALNYSSTQHFSKSFRQVAGVSPGAYKKMFREGSAEADM
ncbi:MAG: AraC family transcriptional regulator [Ruminococcaceae bacterium]|nr:AraC family transcriptional regulator [Oscillospiraceae bacterium]